MLLSLLVACGNCPLPPAALAAPDLRPHIAVRGGGPGAVWLFHGDTPVRVSLPGAGWATDAVAHPLDDLDGDHQPEVLLSAESSAWVVLSGGESPPVGRPLPAPAGVRLAGGVWTVPDLDGDGHDDVAADAVRFGAPVRVVYGTAGPSVRVLDAAEECGR